MRTFTRSLLLISFCLSFCTSATAQQPQIQGYQDVDCSGTSTQVIVTLDTNNCSQTVYYDRLEVTYLPPGCVVTIYSSQKVCSTGEQIAPLGLCSGYLNGAARILSFSIDGCDEPLNGSEVPSSASSLSTSDATSTVSSSPTSSIASPSTTTQTSAALVSLQSSSGSAQPHSSTSPSSTTQTASVPSGSSTSSTSGQSSGLSRNAQSATIASSCIGGTGLLITLATLLYKRWKRSEHMVQRSQEHRGEGPMEGFARRYEEWSWGAYQQPDQRERRPSATFGLTPQRSPVRG